MQPFGVALFGDRICGLSLFPRTIATSPRVEITVRLESGGRGSLERGLLGQGSTARGT